MTVTPKIDTSDPWGGDQFERQWWPRIKNDFPEYETIWAQAVVPLTDRPNNLSLRMDLTDDWHAFGEQHYSIFLHAIAALDRMDHCPQDIAAFEEVYFHLVAALDVANSFLFTIGRITKDTTSTPLPKELADVDQFSAMMREWFLSEGGQDYLERIQKQGRLGALDPFRDRAPALEELIPDSKDLATKYARLNGRLRFARNSFIHGVLQAKIHLADGRILVPHTKVEILKRYDAWRKVKEATNFPDVMAHNFDKIQAIAAGDIQQTLQVLNEVWPAVWNLHGKDIVDKLPPRSKPNATYILEPAISSAMYRAPSSDSTVSSIVPLSAVFRPEKER